MKIAQALSLRKKQTADFPASVALLRSAAISNSHDEAPERSAGALLDSCLSQIEGRARLIAAINRSNHVTKLPNGMSIADALARRDVLADAREKMLLLQGRKDQVRGLNQQSRRAYEDQVRQYDGVVARLGASGHTPRNPEPPVVYKLELDDDKLERVLSDLSRQWRELDDLVQAANWATELTE